LIAHFSKKTIKGEIVVVVQGNKHADLESLENAQNLSNLDSDE
jgi:16S rRNA C1402 (ribose-2'-O) methylase RsmI